MPEDRETRFDLKEVISFGGLCLNLATIICGIVFFCVIKFNDFVHLENNVNKIGDKVDSLIERVSTMEGIISGKGK